MAQSHAAGFSTFTFGRAASRHIRLTVLVSVVAICGSFAAVAALQMRNDRTHALAQAEYFDNRRAEGVAAAAQASLERIAELGRAFADGKQVADVADALGVRNITVFDSNGLALASLHPPALMFLPARTREKSGLAIASPSTMTFPHAGKIVAINFDPRALIPPRLLERAALSTADGAILIQDSNWSGSGATVPLGDWPVVVRTSVDQHSALWAWTGALPLYLFAILGPALAGAGLAFIFVQEFERRARATAAIRSLRTTRPVEAKLLIRLAQAELRAAEDSRAKSEFIAHMSHELRTPLNAISGYAQLMQEGIAGPVTEQQQEFLARIRGSQQHLLGIVNDLLNYSRIEAGGVTYERSKLSMQEVAERVLAMVAPQAARKELRLVLDSREPVVFALADGLKTEQVVLNLVSNAVKFTPEGGTVTVTCALRDGDASIEVRDTGPGIPEDMQEAIFDPFVQLGRTLTSSQEGAGLGLAISRDLARAMDGDVTVQSTPGAGSAFTFRLPAA